MHALVLVLILCVTLASFAVQSLGAPPLLRYAPELLSVLVTILLAIAAARRGLRLLAPKYWLVFGSLLLVIGCGILINGTGAGPILAATRFYFRAIPFFFVPLVFNFNTEQIQQQLKLLLCLGLAQVPIAAYQRWVIYSAGRFAGDDVRGTLQESGTLSILLICAVLVAAGVALRGRINKLAFAALFFLLLFPTTINETKVTIIFLPVGLLVALAVGSPPGRRLRAAGSAAVLLVVFAALFVPIYNQMLTHSPWKNDKDITQFFTDEKKLTRYLSSDVGGLGTKKDVRRGDAIVVPFKYLSRDPFHLAFGLGLGNVSWSAFGAGFRGVYNGVFNGFLIMSFTYFILEIGLLGTTLVLLLHCLIFLDSVAVARQDAGFLGGFAAGWAGIVVLMCGALFYAVVHQFESLSYLYWYFSGLIAARRIQLALLARSVSPGADRPGDAAPSLAA